MSHNCIINAKGSSSLFPSCFAGSQMPPQPPGSQSESSSHPALSQSPMPQERGESSVYVGHISHCEYMGLLRICLPIHILVNNFKGCCFLIRWTKQVRTLHVTTISGERMLSCKLDEILPEYYSRFKAYICLHSSPKQFIHNSSPIFDLAV